MYFIQGFTGDPFEGCRDIDECRSRTLHSCGIGGTCGFSLEGQEVMACRGPAQCLVCRPCLLAWEDERQVDGRGTNRGHCVVCRHRVAAGESAYLPLQGTLLRMVELAGRVAGLTKLE